jgi:UDP:flavonoid glycosyltransferase YjiC (YdhE family)
MKKKVRETIMSERKRIDPVIIRDTDTDEILYTLDFNRDAVSTAERRGFKLDSIGEYPMTACQELFYWSTRMHHKGLRRDDTDKLFISLGGIEADGLIKRLLELYNQAITTTETERNPKLALQL